MKFELCDDARDIGPVCLDNGAHTLVSSAALLCADSFS